MSQLWKVGSSWLNIEQIRALDKQKEVETPAEEFVAQEVVAQEVVASEVMKEEVPTVEDIIPVVENDVFVESELAQLTILELRDIAKQNSIRITGQPSKLALINILMNKK